MGGTATTGAGYPSAANAPLIATPDIALPGSGPAVGAPLSSAATNDSRGSTGPSVYNPNGGIYAGQETNTSSAAAVAGGPATPPGVAAEPFENGIQHFQSGLVSSGNTTLSLGQVARSLRSQHRQAARTYTNDSITQMNAKGVTIGNLGAGASAVAAAAPRSTPPAAGPMQPAPVGTLVAENRVPALPQSDQGSPVTRTQPAAQPSPTAGQQRHRAAEQTAPAPQPAPAASAPQTTAAQAPSNGSKLPQTGSSLPLLLLIGGVGLAGGLLYWLRH
ncbi:MAG TPA: LPXTG cell wall anchor domain-containing protein [Terriglobales bacterium]|nr:LPXTG cell wall anchor domain-containing protein [Terriglobales bacterium]